MNFTIQVQITDKCNMLCPYCYVHRKDNDMTLSIFKQQFENVHKLIKEYTYYVPSTSELNVDYFGGEPLLNLDTIIEIDDYLKSKNIKFKSHIQTNSLLMTDEINKLLKDRNISWSYSYDGLWQDNINCIDIDNTIKPSLPKFYNRFEKEYFRFNTPKTMISPAGIKKHTLLENYKYFTEENQISFPDFTLVRDNVWSSEDIELYKSQLDELTDYLIKQTIESGEVHTIGLFTLYFADTLCGKMYQKRQFCCFSGTNGCVFTPTGVIYPCTRFYSNDKLPLYDTNTDTLYLDNIKFLQNGSDPCKFEKCKSCKIRTYCNAGCNYSQLENNNFEKNEPIDCVCELQKYTYKQAYRYYNSTKDHTDFISFVRRRYGF